MCKTAISCCDPSGPSWTGGWCAKRRRQGCKCCVLPESKRGEPGSQGGETLVGGAYWEVIRPLGTQSGKGLREFSDDPGKFLHQDYYTRTSRVFPTTLLPGDPSLSLLSHTTSKPLHKSQAQQISFLYKLSSLRIFWCSHRKQWVTFPSKKGLCETTWDLRF